MSFLGKLSEQLTNQFSLGENTNHSLNTIGDDGKIEPYGKLGDFASKFDQSAQRRYVEQGYLRTNPYNANVEQNEVIHQQPNATVLIKKRMFSSIAENFRPDFMDKDEKLYYKAMKVLFDNKCKEIAILERLSKIQLLSSKNNKFDSQMLPLLFTLSDALKNGFISDAGLGENFTIGNFKQDDPFMKQASKLVQIVDRLKKIYIFNYANEETTWIKDSSSFLKTLLGEGTGVIEITNFTSINTKTTVEGLRSPGNFNISISDPYRKMTVSEWDIEKALSDASNGFYYKKIFQFGQRAIQDVIDDKLARLNQLRSERNASTISFKINPDTLLSSRVRAIVDRQGVEISFNYDSTGGTGFPGLGGFTSDSVNVSPDYFKDGEILGYDGLNTSKSKTFGKDSLVRKAVPDSELTVFQELVTAIYTKLQQEANSKNSFQATNKLTDYARRKLRFNFLGKLIIQPQDTIHIYMKSQSSYDNKILGGLTNPFPGSGLINAIDGAYSNLEEAFNKVFKPDTISAVVEKTAFVGNDFPSSLWSFVRDQFVSEKEGVHVFGGIVNAANSSWSGGRYNVNISGHDNIEYLNRKVNYKPGVDNFNGKIFDPLTPFKSNFDSITQNDNNILELLDENKYLLSPTGESTKDSIIKFKYGKFAGQHATSDNTIQDAQVDPITNQLNKVYYAPDGLVYKWKEGIGVFVQQGSSFTINDTLTTGVPSTYVEPFAGQDVMNVLSLLITGQPYNFANYWKTAQELYGFSGDPQTRQNPANIYLSALKQDLSKTNALWGNFIPFKNLVISEEAYVQAMQTTLLITQKNQKIENNLRKIEELNNASNVLGVINILKNPSNLNSDTKSKIKTIQDQRDALFNEINKDIQEINNKKKSANYLSDIGGDITFDFDSFLNSDPNSSKQNDPKFRSILRKKLNFLTRRMSYNVRANEDRNLFIVDDFYDKDYDILAYDKAIQNGISLYNSEVTSISDKIRLVSGLLNLEVFCDTQGHIRVRPPQYNRMPSSIFYKMIKLKKDYNIQLFPDYLNKLFTNQLETLKKRIEVIEDFIRLDCAALGYNNDFNAGAFISTSGSDGNLGDDFNFISSETSGTISDVDSLVKLANPDISDDEKNQLVLQSVVFDVLSTQAKATKSIFTSGQRFSTITTLFKQQLDSEGFSVGNTVDFNNNGYVDTLIERIETKTAQRVQRTFFTKNNSLTSGNQGSVFVNEDQIDIVKITNDLAQKIRERQRVLKLFYSILKNASEFRSLDETSNDTANKLLAPDVFGNKDIPETFEHMIEDESEDDLGPGSGSRYVIRNVQIKNLSISENEPEFTSVQVNGYINDYTSFSDNQVRGLDVPGFGNGLTSSYAIDYDMVRNYGYKNTNVITVPFIKDVESQAGPYAVMLLSQARKNILRGNIEINGNEYMQPGEVIYIEDLNMLFYVNSVSHSYAFSESGGNFSTRLDLSYGHTIGDYIPTSMDFIGKIIYNSRDVGDYVIQRQSNTSGDINLGVIIKDPNSDSVFSTGKENQTVNRYSNQNGSVINNIIFSVKNIINQNQSTDNNVVANIELRIYYDDLQGNLDSDLSNFADKVKEALTTIGGPVQKDKNYESPILDSQFVKIVPVNLSDTTNLRYASQKAIDYARSQSYETTMNGGGASAPSDVGDNEGSDQITTKTIKQQRDKIRISLYKYIVDCWVKFDKKAK